jgi:hypothetical protein
MFENSFYSAFYFQEASVTLNFGAAPFPNYDENHFENQIRSNTIDKFGNTELHRAA